MVSPALSWRSKLRVAYLACQDLLIVAGSACGCASTLDITGILGCLISVAANAASNLETAGSMKLVWKAPATAKRT